ncbi:MAG: hypothetical protein ACYDBQ_08140 [Thermoplasmatota archaeon]
MGFMAANTPPVEEAGPMSLAVGAALVFLLLLMAVGASLLVRRWMFGRSP